ncbi:unnamed protein product [Urochloa humidicola]
MSRRALALALLDKLNEMARKRNRELIRVESSQESDDFKFDGENDSDTEKLNDADVQNIYSYIGVEDSINCTACKELLKDYADIKILKRKLALALSCQVVVFLSCFLCFWRKWSPVRNRKLECSPSDHDGAYGVVTCARSFDLVLFVR